jgi:hypothetical protein
MHRREIDGLDATRAYWVLSVISPQRNWSAVPGCRRGSRFLIDGETLRASTRDFTAFETQSECLRWMMEHRADLNRRLPAAKLKPVLLDRWLLGLD